MEKKEQSKLRMQKMRNKKSVTSNSVTSPSVTWEMPLKDILSALPQDITDYIDSVLTRYKARSREDRLRMAFKYQVWHEANFINGIHKDSKYRQYV